MDAVTALFQFLQLGSLLAWLKLYPVLGMIFGGLAGVLAFLVNVGPLKRIQADTLVGKAIALGCVAVMLLGATIFTVQLLATNVAKVLPHGLHETPHAGHSSGQEISPGADLPGDDGGDAPNRPPADG